MKRLKGILLLFLLLVAATVLMLRILQADTDPLPTPEATLSPPPELSPEPTPEPTPTPTPEPTPDMSPLPPEWFDDAVFLGDSVTVALERYCDKSGALGEALFLSEFSYSVRNAVSGAVDIWYQGKPYRPEDVIPLTGATKVYAMLGINDVALYGGIDKTIELWAEMLETIRAKSPDVTFFIESSLPMHYAGQLVGLNNEKLDNYNARLKEFCAENGHVFVDIAAEFKDSRNGMKNEFSEDQYVHVTEDAARLWVELLRDPAYYSVNPRSIDYGAQD